MSVSKNNIRPIAVAIIKRDNKILVSPKYDYKKDWHFFRLLGGGIEFGETSLQALKREIKEELNKDLINCKLLKVSENIFTYKGKEGHELCFIYEADFKDKIDYDFDNLSILDKKEDKAIWVELTKENVDKITPKISIDF